ncbi:MAG: type II toxin-antitoxin system HicB family antitoxin [Bauldia sp.]
MRGPALDGHTPGRWTASRRRAGNSTAARSTTSSSSARNSLPSLDTAQASTEEEALRDAADALSEWAAHQIAHGLALPRARGIAELRDDHEVMEQLDTGACFASVPLLVDTGRPARANFSLDAGLLADIDEAARRSGVTRSAFLAAAARDRIKALG